MVASSLGAALGAVTGRREALAAPSTSALQVLKDSISVDVGGVDHVCVGTDQQTTAGALQDHGNFGRVVDLLLQKGFTGAEAGKLAHENFVPIFAKSAAA